MRRTLEHLVAVPLAQHLLNAQLSRISFLSLAPPTPGTDALTIRWQEPAEGSEPREADVSAPPQDWPQARARMAALQATVDAFVSGTALAPFERIRSEKIAQLNQRQLTTLSANELQFASRMVEVLPELRDRIEQLVDQVDPEPDYVTTRRNERNDALYESQPRYHETVRPVRSVKDRFDVRLGEQIHQAELDLLELSLGVHIHANPDARPALLVARSVGSSRSSQTWLLTVARLIVDSLPERTLQTFALYAEEDRPPHWEPMPFGTELGTRSEIPPSDFRDRGGLALALQIPGPDAALRFEPELGFWVRSLPGSSRDLACVHLSEVNEPHLSPIEALDKFALQKMLCASDLANTPVVRWFVGACTTGPGTTLDLNKPETLHQAWMNRARAMLKDEASL